MGQFLTRVRRGLGQGTDTQPMPIVVHTNEERDASAHWQPFLMECARMRRVQFDDAAQLVDIDGVPGWMLGVGKTAGYFVMPATYTRDLAKESGGRAAFRACGGAPPPVPTACGS